MERFGLALIGLVLVVGCSDKDTAAPHQSQYDAQALRSIASELAIQKGMNILCERDAPDQLSAFMEDLRYEDVDRGVREDIMEESLDMMNKVSAEQPEYICTPEMFESADSRVSLALLSWDEMRGITQ